MNSVALIRMNRVLTASALAMLAACSSAPPVPDWQMNARASLDRGVAAWLEGNARVATAEFARARAAASSTGRVDVLARVELTRCAARVASLDFTACDAFETLRADAAAPERAYGDYLAGRLAPQDVALLPEQHRGAAGALPADPLARLVAAAVRFNAGSASPATVQAAVDAASAQGWRRPLLAWLGVQAALADKAGDAEEAARIRRRIAIAQGG